MTNKTQIQASLRNNYKRARKTLHQRIKRVMGDLSDDELVAFAAF